MLSKASRCHSRGLLLRDNPSHHGIGNVIMELSLKWHLGLASWTRILESWTRHGILRLIMHLYAEFTLAGGTRDRYSTSK